MRRRTGLAWVLAAQGVAIPWRAAAEPLRVRADAQGQVRAPAGLIVLQGQDRRHPWIDVEGLVWAGARNDPTADVLALALRLRAPRGWGELKLGRFVVSTGAIRPLALDGVSAIGRAAWGLSAEAFAGIPVAPRLGASGHDRAFGGRLSQGIASRATVGVSFVEQRSLAGLDNREIGADFAAAPIPSLDLAARGSYDLTSPGVADALVSGATRAGPFRFELFGTHRSPSRLLPATSLFSVLGDLPSQVLGSTVRWEAAPRLDVLLTGAGQDIGGQLGGYGTLRSTLRLDDRGQGSVGLELKRQDVARARWTGVRGVVTQPVDSHFRLSSELELAAGDVSSSGTTTWLWGLVALGWRSGTGWEAAGAIEAGSSPRFRFEVNGLLRVARTLEIP